MINLGSFESLTHAAFLITPRDRTFEFEEWCNQQSTEKLFMVAKKALKPLGSLHQHSLFPMPSGGREGLIDLLVGMWTMHVIKDFPE